MSVKPSTNAMTTKMSVPEFFRGLDIFITGGSGFLGKALIEKLLRSCSDLNRIFVLIRGKKGKTPQERLELILGEEYFNTVRSKDEKLLGKVVAIEGDVTLNGLGMSEADRVRLKDVSVVFHNAASVKFDDPLKEAILMNTKSTLETYKLAEGLKNIKAFIHVSTTYSNPHEHVVEEEFYPMSVDWRTTIKLAETYNTEILNILNLKYSGFQPNTYTFTKGLAEQIAHEYKDRLPILIFRPSIVISSVDDPIPGWVDNFNGPVGMFLASGIGILRTAHGDPDICLDYIPVDVCVRAMIISAYKKGIEGHNPKELVIYNASSAAVRAVKTGEIIEIAKKLIRFNPMEQTLWVPGGGITNNKLRFYIRFYILHLFFAIILDSALRLSSKKPFFVRLQRKILAANNALYYFNVTPWLFKNDTFFNLNEYILPLDTKDFAFRHYTQLDIMEYFGNALTGAKYFLLKQPMKPSKSAIIKFRILLVVDYTLKVIFWTWLAKTVFLFAYRHLTALQLV